MRTAKGLTLDQLAQATGSAKSYIWDLENKKPPRPSVDKLSAIAQALGVTVDYLFGRDEQSVGDATDLAFFREYAGLPDATKEQLRQMAKILGAKKENDRARSTPPAQGSKPPDANSGRYAWR